MELGMHLPGLVGIAKKNFFLFFSSASLPVGLGRVG